VYLHPYKVVNDFSLVRKSKLNWLKILTGVVKSCFTYVEGLVYCVFSLVCIYSPTRL